MAEVNNSTDDANHESDRPVVELFVKAAVDKMKNGGCPICHRYFLVFYILRERGLVDLVVTTFLPENPPKEVTDFSTGKHYPLVKVHKGIDARGQDMTGVECDTVDDIESLLERFECDDMYGRKESAFEAKAETVFEDLYKKFNLFLKKADADPQNLNRLLTKLDAYLRDKASTFLLGDRLARADCYLLPTIQHIRVAGKAYKNFEIPTDFTNVWRYLRNVYETDAFKESCPADREIITHYDGKASTRAKVTARNSKLLGEERTFSIPAEVDSGNGYTE